MSVNIDFGPVIRAVNQVGARVEHVSTEVGQVKSDLSITKQQLDELKRAFDEYLGEARRTANIQRAETKLSGLKDDLERAFGHYSVVRRTSIGILQAFDVGNVSNSTVTQVGEELMIQTPRYWLAPAIVALAAWSKDDQHIAEISVQEAFSRDKRKASLFFALVLRRMGRTEGAVRWLRHYLIGIDPTQLGREFAVIFESVAQGAFGPEGDAIVAERMAEWNKVLRADPELMDGQVDRWKKFVETRGGQLASDEYPLLRRFSPDFPVIQNLLESADSVPAAIEEFEATREKIAVQKTSVEDLLDDILEMLVTEFDEEELPLRRDITYQEAIVEEQGDLDRARELADTNLESLEQTVDSVTLQTAIAMHPEPLGVSIKAQQIAIGSSRIEIERGIGRFITDYRSKILPSARIEFDNTHNGYASTFGFIGWKTDTLTPEDKAISSLREAWAKTFASYMDRVRLKVNTLMAWAVVIGLVFLITLVAQIWVLAAIIAVGGGGALAIVWWTKSNKAKKALAYLEEVRDKAVEDSVLILRGTIAEYVDAGMSFSELDKQEPDLLKVVRTWPVGQAPEEVGAKHD
ncbi:MAG: hypothetical protein KF742_02500 [Cryobacterium sp.]|nr:hypothetical protein [Cryobacterium sp.]